LAVPKLSIGLLAASGALVAGSAVTLVSGGRKVQLAQDRLADCETRRKATLVRLCAERDQANEALRSLSQAKQQARQEVVFRLRDFVAALGVNVRTVDYRFLDEADYAMSTEALEVAIPSLDVTDLVPGVVIAGQVAGATPVILKRIAVKWGTAGTGRMINTLRGQPATNAVEALFGSGPKSLGGLGRAGGRFVLKASAVGAGAAVIGVTAKIQTAKAVAQAVEACKTIDEDIAELNVGREFMRATATRAGQLERILARLTVPAVEALDVLESEPYDDQLHGDRLDLARNYVASLTAIITAPIIDERGNLDAATEQLILTHASDDTESPDA
jgi:hypothetical protein